LTDSTDPVGVGSVGAEISNAVVRLLSEYTGRGPTKARTHIHEDLITVVLRDTLTKGERSLVAAGKTEVVLDARKAYQNAMKTDLVATVEHCSGRKVAAFLSENHIEPDIAIESFVLESRGGESASDAVEATPGAANGNIQSSAAQAPSA
jgi:uncharacterized protein YbcI